MRRRSRVKPGVRPDSRHFFSSPPVPLFVPCRLPAARFVLFPRCCFCFPRFFLFLNASFRNARTHFFSDRMTGLAQIAVVATHEQKETKKHREQICMHRIVDKSCCAALYLLSDWHRPLREVAVSRIVALKGE